MTNGDKSTRHREDTSDPVRTRPTPSTYGAILFDFDLTLCDSSAGAVDCIQHAMETMGFAAPAEGVARATIGLSLPETFATLADDVDGANPNAERADRFATLFVERADEVMVEKARLYPGVDRTLTVLRERGYRLGVVSNKFRHRVQDICPANGIGDEFDIVVGSEDVTDEKPAPEPIQRAMTSLDIDRARTLYVGDSNTDGKAAASADVDFAAVGTGTTTRQELRAWKPVAIVDDVTALPDAL